jgi:tetratricopeptide (TPR) repeat protein
MLAGNPLVTQSPLAELWTNTQQPDYWPLAYSTHWFEYRLWGAYAPGYRAVNLLLHIGNALLVWHLAARLVPSLAGAPAWACGLLFVVHPVTVEAVAWLLQRKSLLSTLGALAALDCYLQYERGGRRRWYVAALACFTAGMLSKTAIVFWPGVLLLCDWWQRRTITRADLRRAAPFFGISLVLGLVALWFQQHGIHSAEVVRDDRWISRLFLGCQAYWFYLGKAFWPAHLNFVYPRWRFDPHAATSYLPALALVALIAVAWRWRRSWSAALGATLAYQMLALGPVLGLVTIYYMRYSLVADHWQYLALPGLIVLVIGATWSALSRAALAFPRLTPRVGNGLAAALLVIAVALFVPTARRHAALFGHETNAELWLDTLAKNDRAWMAMSALATSQAQTLPDDPAQARAQLEEAVRLYRRAAELEPNDVAIHYNLGAALASLDRNDEALVELMRAVQLNPNSPDAQFNLGVFYVRLQRWNEALAPLETVIHLHPNFASAHTNLGIALAEVGRTTEAVEHWRAALAIDPHQQLAAERLQAMPGASP